MATGQTSSFLAAMDEPHPFPSHLSANLPTDVIAEIFSRLPTKSLARFNSVSKPMCALLHCESFIKNQLKKAKERDLPNLILKQDFKMICVEDKEWRRTRRLNPPFFGLLERAELSGTCNGLVCISDHTRNEDIFLYNPCTGRYNKIPITKFDVPTVEHSCFTALGFGYHRKEDDYKVMRVIYLYDQPLKNIDSYVVEARIYSLREDKWRKTVNVPFHLSSRAAIWLENEDTLVWKASRGFGQRMQVLIVSFDMNKEVFAEVTRPPLLIQPEECQIEISELQGCFTVFHLWRNEGVEVWTMKKFGDEETWTRTLVLGRPLIREGLSFMYLKPIWVKKSGDVVVEKSGNKLILYERTKRRVRNMVIVGTPRYGFAASTFIGSLVSPFPAAYIRNEEED